MMAGELGALQQAKLVLLGDMGAGKSSLVLRFVKGQFFDYQVRFRLARTVGCVQMTAGCCPRVPLHGERHRITCHTDTCAIRFARCPRPSFSSPPSQRRPVLQIFQLWVRAPDVMQRAHPARDRRHAVYRMRGHGS